MDKLKEYAEIVLRTGINLQKGQCVRIRTSADDYYFARILGNEAYRLGARHVQTEIMDNHLLKSRLQYQKKEDLEYMPGFLVEESREMLAEDWANITIDPVGENDVLKETDPEKISFFYRSRAKKLQFYRKSMMADEHAWCVICVPGREWAEKVLGRGAGSEDLWAVLKPILRLDREDPLAAWKEHNDSLHRRCDEYNKLKFDSIRFQSKGTDLTVGLNPRSIWAGGPVPLTSGRLYNGNIPSEEIFTTPDWRRTEGHVLVTRPLTILEKTVSGIELLFDKGRVVSYSAESGEDVLKEFLETDEGSVYLGEVALVQNDSPISNSGLIFQSILYDENASCHIAIGAGYPTCLSGSAELDTPEKLKEAGCNDSLVHTDFMIGAPDTRITGITSGGREIVIMDKGNFTL